ncbi:MAG: hypothetical protein LBN39_10075 [Planctomycetaceae bacterium]|jgi:hypothetical protein|nr:hypothetical protein [Planctomycetaceae bacterium]
MSDCIRFNASRQLRLCAFFLFFGIFGTFTGSAVPQRLNAGEPAWKTDYAKAVAEAKKEGKNLLIYFYTETDVPALADETEEKWVKTKNGTIRQVSSVAPEDRKLLPLAEKCRNFESEILGKDEIVPLFDNYVKIKLPLNAETTDADGNKTAVLDLPDFREMLRHPGLVVVDFEHPNEPYYETMTGILPFLRAKVPTAEQTEVFLTLPPGTLSQRTLIYAMRIHPDKPLSTSGDVHPAVVRGATEHAEYQSQTGVIGHQNFGTRTAKITAEIGQGSPSEICAQSWSGENLFEAAIGCVRAWRSSSGHWSIARKKHTFYGYDIVKGENDIWFAVGLFVD